MKTKKFNISDLKKEIKNQYGSFSGLKKHLKSIAKYEYGCYFSQIKIYGCEIFYTSNPNHFCSFGIKIPMVGMSETLGLGKSSITKAGKLRGCSKYYIAI